MTTAQVLFNDKVKQLIAQSRSLSPAAQKQVVDMLQEARTRIIGELAQMDPARFTSAQLQSLKLSIDNALQAFGRNASSAIAGFQSQAAQNGIAMVDQPIAAAFGPMSIGQVSIPTLSIAQGYTADLITALSQSAAAQVNAAIQRAFLGGQTIQDIIEQVGRGLSGGKFDGMFGPIGERATSIATNEILRVSSISAQSRFEQLSDKHPDLQKQWLHIKAARVPRLAHVLASGQVVDVDKPFVIAGEELMYPRDPNGSAWNTIGCHCLMRPYFSADALKSSADDTSLLDKLGLKVTVTRAA